MTKKEAIVNVLNEHSCLTCIEIKGFVKRKYDMDITPQSVGGTLRPLVSAGMVGKSTNVSNKMVYWLTDYGKEHLFK